MTHPPLQTHWQGVPHIALQTADLDATLQFYRDVLGMRIGEIAPGNFMHGRHAAVYTMSAGAGTFLHFFENPNAEIVPPPDLTTMHWMPGALHHISLGVPDLAAAQALFDALHARGMATTDMMDQGDVHIFLFIDNNGILLEVNWAHLDD